jgi:aspartate/methionine/tyrosine aminotransferase
MALQPNRRSNALRESVTLAIAAQAKRMRSDGIDVISLSAGEPDFGTMGEIAEAGIQAIRNGQTRYTSAAGTPELRAAGAAWFRDEFGLDYGPDQVMATAGIKPALHMALMAIVEPGDPVLLPAPYWVSYPSLVQLAGGVPVDVAAVPEQGFVHTGDQIRAAAAAHGAKGLLLNFPNNPSGAVADRAQTEELVAAAVDADLWIISDEIYAAMTYDDAEFVSPATIAPDRTIVVNGGSKSHSLTGWRIGFLAGPADIVRAAAKIQSQVLGNPSSISQAAGLEAVTGDFSAELARRAAAFDERRRYLVRTLNEIDGIEVEPPKGAFYVMADVRALCTRLGLDDVGLAQKLLDDVRLAVVPGQPFAAPGFIRLSYAASMATLEQAVARLRQFVEAI